MKRTICVLFCIVQIFFLCSCDFEFMSPDSLVTAPKSNQEKMQQKQLITSFLGREEHLIVPEDMDNTDAYQYMDVDMDGEDELIAFYASKENNFVLGFIILDQTNGQWFLSHKAMAYGTGIHYFSMQDLDEDGNMELLLGVRTGYGSLKELYIYQLNQKEMKEFTKNDRVTYDQITMAKNAADENVIVTVRMDTSVLEGSSNLVVYQYQHGVVYPVYNETFDGYCSQIRFAQVTPDEQGVYLAMRHNHFVNILLLKETEEGFAVLMEHPLPYDNEDMQELTLFADSNSDGVLEVNSLWAPENNTTTKTYKDYIQVWLQWDGMDGMRAVEAVLEDRKKGYRFQIPLNWLDSLYYEFRSENDISWTDFYYLSDSGELERVFSVTTLNQLVWKELEKPESFVVLGNNPLNNEIYIADIKKREFDGFEVTESRLISCLQIEGGERK